MKITQQQLRQIVKEEIDTAAGLTQARRPQHTGRKNPATGFGYAKKDRSTVQAASSVADLIVDEVESLLEGFDADSVAAGLQGLVGPEVDRTKLEEAIVDAFKRKFDVEKTIVDLAARVLDRLH